MSTIIYDQQAAIQLAGGNESLARDLLAMLKQQLPEFRASLEASIEAQDIEQVKDVAHKLHGGLNYCSAPALKESVVILDNAVLESTVGENRELVEKVTIEIDRLLAADITFN